MPRTRSITGLTADEPHGVAAYIRVSTDDQARSGLGVEAQKSRCAAMAVVKNWPAPIYYIDEGVSGTKARRPQLDRLLADAEAGKIQAVIILSLDRLGRQTRLILDLVARITQHAVLVSCKESFDTQTPQGAFVLTIFAAFSQLERDLISQRTSAALAEKSRRDGNGAGRIPYGYLCTADGVIIDPAAAEVIRRIFLLRKRGISLRDIAADLNQRAHRSPRSNGIWHHTSVRAVLDHRDAYLGGRRGKSALRWPPIIRNR